ncbi:MAG: bud neck involved protein [Alyxoria varia]|nr:MAG: bud neck involved protein [Alyxoria varia]
MPKPRSTPSENYSNGHGGQQQHQSQPKLVQMPRNNFNSHSGASGYRGTSAAPAYAFKATPNLKKDSRSTSAPPSAVLHGQASESAQHGSKAHLSTAPSLSTTSSSSENTASSNPSSTAMTWSEKLFSKDDSILGNNFEIAPFSTESSSLGDLTLPGQSTTASTEPVAKPPPNRYRRGQKSSDIGPSTAGNSKLQQNPNNAVPMGQFAYNAEHGTLYSQKLSNGLGKGNEDSKELAKETTKDSTVPTSKESATNTTGGNNEQKQAGVQSSQSQSAPTTSMNRYRRRSNVGIDTPSGSKSSGGTEDMKVSSATLHADFPSSPHEIRPPSANHNSRPSSAGAPNARSTGGNSSSGPAKTFAEVARRTNSPSPLSRPLSPDGAGKENDPSSSGAAAAGGTQPFQHSPAVAAMAALNEKDGNKGVKSRLRRAFSFSSSAELNKRVSEPDPAVDRAQARKEQFSSELDEEQSAIARQQEAAGLGESIYSGQAGFTGSTDNLSISSTASSASLMLRKMGKNVKKGGRSIKGLFRPKSAIGVPPPDEAPGASAAKVSMVTVEAEREKLNINVDPHEQSGGGTGFPKLERNSVDAVRKSGSNGEGDHNDTRKSIVGGEQERSEVLAAVKRGILKREDISIPSTTFCEANPSLDTSSYSSAGSPTGRASESPFMHHENGSVERRASPVPSNTSSEPQRNGHRRTDSVNLEHDYFGGMPRMAASNYSSRSLPGTPKSTNRISFSPRIQFYDVSSSSEYDRRGEIATCNRLTPMLAQQIKEELNTFKMEMEVHESSKPHTHFF